MATDGLVVASVPIERGQLAERDAAAPCLSSSPYLMELDVVGHCSGQAMGFGGQRRQLV